MIPDQKVKQKYQYNIELVLFCFFVLQNFPINAQEDTVRYKLPEITVTTTRYEESLLEIPLAVSVINQHEISNTRGAGLNEALWSVPGVIAQSRTGGTDIRLTIRGFGARGAGERSNAGTSRGIKVLMNGIPETEPDGRTAFDMIDAQTSQRIEVVRSNASALYGSASGGVINIQTNTKFTQPSAEIGSSLGNFGFMKNYLGLGTLLVDNTRLYVNISHTTSDGWREQSSSRRTLISTGINTSLSSDAELSMYLSAVSNLYHIPGPLTPTQYKLDPRQANPVMKRRNERRFNRQGKIAFTFSKDFGDEHSIWAMGFVAPKVLQRSERNTFRDFNRYHIGGSGIYHWEKELTSSLKNHLSVGFDESYQDGSHLFYSLTSSGDRGDTLRQNKREAAGNFGIFLQDEVHLGSYLNLVFGFRYDVQEYIYQDFQRPKDDAKQVFEQVTPKIAVSYLFNAEHTVYANIGGGAETPAFNEVDPPPDSLIMAQGGTPIGGLNPLLNSTTSVTYEIGTKGFFYTKGFLTSLSYDAAVFYLTIYNDIIPWAGGRYYFTAGRSRRYGLEFAVNARTTSNLSLITAMTLMDSKYLEYRNNLGSFDRNKTGGIPPFSLNTRVKYAVPSKGFFEVGVEHLSSYIADDANLVQVPPYVLFHVSGGTTFVIGSTILRIFAGITNLTDQRYVSSVYINPEKIQNEYSVYEPGLPRSLFGTITVVF